MKLASYKLWAWIATVLLVGIIALYVFEARALDNTVGAGDLIQKSAITGFLFGLATGIYFREHLNSKEAVKTMRSWVVCLFTPVILFPLLVSFSNRFFSHDEKTVVVEFLEEKPFFDGTINLTTTEQLMPEGFHLFVFHQGKIERFTTEKQCCPEFKRGKQMEIKLRKGVFGYDFMER